MRTMMRYMLRAAAALMLLAVLPAAAAAEFAVVQGGRLNLRQYPDSGSYSLGKYETGSWVHIDESTNGWYRVSTMDGKRGYMASNYLRRAAATASGTVKYANGGYVNLRTGPSLNDAVAARVTSGTQITILDDTYEWNRVRLQTGGTYIDGYMHDSFIARETGSAVITTRNGGKVNLRSGPSKNYKSMTSLASGTRVQILLKGNGWYQISANGQTGFMSTTYLSGTGATAGGSTGTTGTRIAYVNNPKATQVLNLRETPSQSARSIGAYRNGTQVKVVEYGSSWCKVYVGTRQGYMMTRYLSFNGQYVQPSYMATPNYIYITPVPTAQPTATPAPTATPKAPESYGLAAGTAATLLAYADRPANVYSDAQMTTVKSSYTQSRAVTILQYNDVVTMVLVDGGVGYVYTSMLTF